MSSTTTTTTTTTTTKREAEWRNDEDEVGDDVVAEVGEGGEVLLAAKKKKQKVDESEVATESASSESSSEYRGFMAERKAKKEASEEEVQRELDSFVMDSDDGKRRCWGSSGSAFERHYHDFEFGVPCYDDDKIFEFLTLCVFQAGLNWKQIINKRENLRKAFSGFRIDDVALFGKKEVDALMESPDGEIVRNLGKIERTIQNAQAIQNIRAQFGMSFAKWLWTGDNVPNNKVIVKPTTFFESWCEIDSPLSRKLAKKLKGYGLTGIGPILIYCWMQNLGFYNMHLDGCWRSYENQVKDGVVKDVNEML